MRCHAFGRQRGPKQNRGTREAKVLVGLRYSVKSSQKARLTQFLMNSPVLPRM